MEKLLRRRVLMLFALVLAVSLHPQKTQARPAVGISFQVFYDNLSPYGRWVNDRQYGNIWIPDVDRDFQPYASRGHWIQTGYGNTWVSDYEWGWAPFHYGRWVQDDFYGWAWIPGDEWGPGWVDWRSGGGYYGWAPMGPSIHISINIPLSRWIFVAQRDICQPDIYNYRVYGNRGGDIYQHTTVINNYYTINNHRYAGGPRFEEIERVTSRPVRVYTVHDGDRPGRVGVGHGDLNIYRPSIDPRAADQGPSRVAADGRNRNTNANTPQNDPRLQGDDRRPGRGQSQSPANTDNRGGINWQQGNSAAATAGDNPRNDRSTPDQRGQDNNRQRTVAETHDNTAEAANAREQQRNVWARQRQEQDNQQGDAQRQGQNNPERSREQRSEPQRQQQQQPDQSRQQQQPREQAPGRSRPAAPQRQQEQPASQDNGNGRPQRVG